MPRQTNAALKLMRDFRAYDAQRDKQIRKLERTLERTLEDLRALGNEQPKVVRRRRRRKAEATIPMRRRSGGSQPAGSPLQSDVTQENVG